MVTLYRESSYKNQLYEIHVFLLGLPPQPLKEMDLFFSFFIRGGAVWLSPDSSVFSPLRSENSFFIKFAALLQFCYNSSVMLKISQKITSLILALSFTTVVLFGLNMGMETRDDGTMSGCMFDQSVTCPMDYEEHVNHWQQTFTATQPTQNTLFALLVVIALGGTTLLFHSWLNWQQYAQQAHFVPQSVHKQREIIAKLSDHILRALSNGILNPKLYNFAYTIS